MRQIYSIVTDISGQCFSFRLQIVRERRRSKEAEEDENKASPPEVQQVLTSQVGLGASGIAEMNVHYIMDIIIIPLLI